MENFNNFGKNSSILEDDQIIEKILPKYRGYCCFCLSEYKVNFLLFEKSIGNL